MGQCTSCWVTYTRQNEYHGFTGGVRVTRTAIPADTCPNDVAVRPVPEPVLPIYKRLPGTVKHARHTLKTTRPVYTRNRRLQYRKILSAEADTYRDKYSPGQNPTDWLSISNAHVTCNIQQYSSTAHLSEQDT